MRAGWRLATVLFVACGLIAGEVTSPAAMPAPPAPAAPAVTAPPAQVPDAAAQERIAKELRAIYAAEYASRKPGDRLALIRKLLEQGRQPGDAASRFVLLDEAVDLAAKACEVELAQQALDAIASGFRIDIDPLRLTALATVVQGIATIDQAVAATTAGCELADAACAHDAYALAAKALSLAETAARRARDPGLAAQVRSQAEQVKILAEGWNQVGEVEDALGTIAPAGHSRLGRFLALLKHDWTSALPHLAAGDDAALRQAAQSELAATTGAARLAAADAWYELASKERASAKTQLLLHSAGLYLQAMPDLGGLERARADKRLGELDRALAGNGPRSDPRRPAGAVLFLTCERDSFGTDGGRAAVLDSSGHGLKARMMGAKPVTGAYGGAIAFGPGVTSLDCGNPRECTITGSMTIAMWLRPAELGARRNPFYKSYGGEGAITLEAGGTLNYFYGQVGADADPYQGFASSAALKALAWNHIVLVRDLGPAKLLTWYVDGKRSNSVAAAYPTAKASTNPLQIGFGYTGVPYVGLLDEFGLWPRALSEAEVQTLYESSRDGR